MYFLVKEYDYIDAILAVTRNLPQTFSILQKIMNDD